MPIDNISPSQFVDLFPEVGNQPGVPQGAKFGAEEREVDLFAPAPTTTTDQTTQPEGTTTTEQTTLPPAAEGEVEADLFKPEDEGTEAGKPGRKPKYDFSDTKGYFEDRIKKGKFVAIEQEDEKGEITSFIPSTPEEFDEVIDIQVDHKLQQKAKELENSWYKTKSPAWQVIAKYAELTDDPAEVLPFIQGVRNIDTVDGIDPATPEGAEQIVRTRLLQRGESESVIDMQIEALRSSEKLISTAEIYKPLILEEERSNLAAMTQQKQKEEQEYELFKHEVRTNAIKAIEAPLYGKKLKTEEKAAIYELIAEPDAESQGFPIYTVIDALYERKDFDTLRQIALLIAKKESLVGYISQGAKDETAAQLQRRLRVATEGRGSSTHDQDAGTPPVQRQPFKPQGQFGRA